MAKRRHSEDSRKLHDQIIADVLSDWPEAKTSGFMRAIKNLPDADYMTDLCAHDPQWVRYVNFIPDAYLIDPAKKHVVVFEAVVTNDVSADKFDRMAEMAWALDEDYYELILIRCDRFGRQVFAPQLASILNAADLVRAGKPASVDVIEDWQKYTVAHCAERIAA